jgi:hypothetical protein
MVFVHRADEDTGIAVLGDFRAATVSGPGAVDAFSSTLTVYIEHRGLNRANAGGIVQAASAWAPAPAPSAKVGAHPFEPGEVTVRSAGEGWALLDVHPRRGVISVQSLTGDFLNVLLPLRDAAYSGHTLHGAP